MNVFWKCEKLHGVQSSMGCLQNFRDKSQTFLKAKTTSLYSLHATLLNVSKDQRRNHITAGQTVCEHLPVKYRRKDKQNLETCESIKFENGHCADFSRVEILQKLYELIILRLNPLKTAQIKGLDVNCRMGTDHVPLFFMLVGCCYTGV